MKLKNVKTGDILGPDKNGDYCKLLFVCPNGNGVTRNAWQSHRTAKTDKTTKRVYGSLRNFLDTAGGRGWKVYKASAAGRGRKKKVTLQEIADNLGCNVENLEITDRD